MKTDMAGIKYKTYILEWMINAGIIVHCDQSPNFIML